MLFLGNPCSMKTYEQPQLQTPPRLSDLELSVYPKSHTRCLFMDGSGSKQSGTSHPQLFPTLGPVLAGLSSCPWSHPPWTAHRWHSVVWLQDVSRASFLVQAGQPSLRGSSGENPASYFLQALPISVHPLLPTGRPPGLPHRLSSRLPLPIEFNFRKDENAKICGIILITY